MEDLVDEDEEAESESMLIAAAADLVAALCEAIGENYVQYFDVFLPLIAKNYVSVCLCETIKIGVSPSPALL